MSRGGVALGAAIAVAAAASACSGGSDDPLSESGESWCDVVAASNALDDEFDAIDRDDGAGFESVIRRIDALSDQLRAAAPGALESQVATYADTNDELVRLFEAADFDIDLLDSAALGAAVSDIDGVATEIDVFTVAECGEPLGPDDT